MPRLRSASYFIATASPFVSAATAATSASATTAATSASATTLSLLASAITATASNRLGSSMLLKSTIFYAVHLSGGSRKVSLSGSSALRIPCHCSSVLYVRCYCGSYFLYVRSVSQGAVLIVPRRKPPTLPSKPPLLRRVLCSALCLSLHPSHRGGALLRRRAPPRPVFLQDDRRPALSSSLPTVRYNRRFSLSGDPSYRHRHLDGFLQGNEMGFFVCGLGLVSPSKLIQFHLSLVSKPSLWGKSVVLTNLLRVFNGFIGIFTETVMVTTSYLSFPKSLLVLSLPVGSLGTSSSSFSLSSIAPSSSSAFSWRSVFPSAQKRRCLSKSITVLLSCGAVRSGPEDAAGFVSTIIRGADWKSTSLFNVTMLRLPGFAVVLVLTHSSCALSSLSFYLRGFSTPIMYVLWFYACSAMNCCSPKV
ncbi:hypothetical protein N665_0505s0029 [Sinapis alba]|nr:hypothetical protein N665_0505s0029 [Sinapis alba]